jgi:hypothetical protein
MYGREGLGCTVTAVVSGLDLLLHLNFCWSCFTCESALEPITSKTRAHRGGPEIVTREPNLPDFRYLPLSNETVADDEEDRTEPYPETFTLESAVKARNVIA